MSSRRLVIAATAFWLGYVALLVTVPRLWPPDPTLPSAAAALGYDTNMAFLTAVGWSLLGLLGFGVLAHTGWLPRPRPPEAREKAAQESGRWLEIIAAFALFALLYFPPFLARYGHYIEDNYFLSVLSRMECGQVPYRDFEFLYGPLMIYPVHAWVRLVGFSMQSYYTILAVAEGALFALMMWIFQRYVSDRRARLIAFLLFAPFLLDTLLGFNTIAWRRIPALFVLLIVAWRPRETRAMLAAGAIAGVQIAYSYEYGLIGLGAALCIPAATWLGPERRGTILAALCLAGSAAITWLAAAGLATGSTFPDYLDGTREILATANALGLGQFEFYWTLHSLSLFALLAAAVLAVGGGLLRIFREPLSEGDRLLLGALAFVTVGLKAALQRADVWHVSAPFAVLVGAFLLSPPRRLFSLGTRGNRLVVALIAVAGIAQIIGLMPTGSYFAAGLVRGAVDTLSGRPPAGPIESRVYSVESELTTPREEVVALAAFLAKPERASRPVFFYGDRWALGYHVGVCPSGYSFYDLLYSDAKAPMKKFLNENADAYIVMASDAYHRLFEGAGAPGTERHLSTAKRLGTWLSTVHHRQTPIEREAKYQLWKRELGASLTSEWVRVAQFGEEVVLAKRGHDSRDPGGM